MRVNNIAFSNLRAEMARHESQLTIQSIADGIGMDRRTLSLKLSRKNKMFLDEAFLIQQKYFPNLSVRYLFEELANDMMDDKAS